MNLRKKRILISLFLWINVFIFAQDEDILVLNKENGKSVEFTISILYKNNKIVSVQKSGLEGIIKIDKNIDFDFVEFKRLGFEKLSIEKDYLLNTVYLKPIPKILDEVIVTAQIIPGNKYQSPFKLKFFTKEEIESKNAVNLADFLHSENNFRVTQDPNLGSVASLNGMSGQDLKILIDGVPVAGRVNGNIDISQLLLNNIERIEVVDGPLSVIYGTNSTGGVINLISKSKVQDTLNLVANTYYESVGQYNFDFNIGINHNDNQMQFNFGRNFFNGFDPNDKEKSQNVKPIWRDKTWNPKEMYFAGFNFYRKFSKNNNINLKYNFFNELIQDKKDPTSIYSINAMDYYYKTQKHTFSATQTNKIANIYELINSSSFTIFDRITSSYFQDLEKGKRLFLNDNKESFYNFFHRALFRKDAINSNMKLMIGIDFNYDLLNSYKLNETNKSMFEIGIFNMMNFQLTPTLFFQPGLRMVMNSRFVSPITPTVNFRYELSKLISSRISYSRGYRNPELKELYFEFIDNNHNIKGNSALQTEINDNIQFGIDIKHNEKSKTNLTSYTTSITASFIFKEDAIDLVPIDIDKNEYKYINIGKFKNFVYSIDNRIVHDNFIFNFGTNILSNQRKYTGANNQIVNMFYNYSLNTNATYTLPKNKLKLNINTKYLSPYKYSSYNIATKNVETTEYSSYFIIDIDATKSFFDNKIKFNLGLKNLLNIKNSQINGYNNNFHSSTLDNTVNFLWGRTLFASFTYKFVK